MGKSDYKKLTQWLATPQICEQSTLEKEKESNECQSRDVKIEVLITKCEYLMCQLFNSHYTERNKALMQYLLHQLLAYLENPTRV